MTERTVADETLGRIARQQWDLFRRVKEGTLDPEMVSSALQSVIEGHFGQHPLPAFKYDKWKDGWTLVVAGLSPAIVSPKDLELVSFLREGESVIKGEEMVRRARELRANYGQAQAEFFLEHQEEIPAEFRSYYLVFPATVWADRRGDRGVPCLGWDGGRWDLFFRWLEDGFRSYDRLLRPRE